MVQAQGRVLIIAGSDSGGGAGLQGDLKTVTMLGGYGATAVTAVTVQNTLGVTGVHPIPLDLIEAQARAVLDDIGADAIKTGMLGDVDVVERVAQILDSVRHIPAVIDPVMIAKGGHPLLADRAIGAVRSLMIPRAALLTPNAPEAAALTGLAVETLDDQRRAGEALLKLGANVTLCGPPTLVPKVFEQMGCRVTWNLEEALRDADVVNLLRIQHERQRVTMFPSLGEYTALFGLNQARMKWVKPDALIMHPGPINRGVEIEGDIADGPQSVILEQVTNGLAVRMAVLFLVTGGRADEAG